MSALLILVFGRAPGNTQHSTLPTCSRQHSTLSTWTAPPVVMVLGSLVEQGAIMHLKYAATNVREDQFQVRETTEQLMEESWSLLSSKKKSIVQCLWQPSPADRENEGLQRALGLKDCKCYNLPLRQNRNSFCLLLGSFPHNHVRLAIDLVVQQQTSEKVTTSKKVAERV